MRLERLIKKSLMMECDKLITRYHKYHNALHVSYKRNTKRIKTPPSKTIKVPDYWDEPLFNPFYVRKRASSIARSIARKISSDEYCPHRPHVKDIPKQGGGMRTICVYEIPDAAVSNYLFHSLMRKNQHRFSSFSYAYRQDRNVHYAIQDIAISLKYQDRLFISEFDFSDFFGSIDHQFLFGQFSENGFLISEAEAGMIRQFLSDRETGIPQGTSLSLFLANMSCWKMDRAFESEGLRFARYADDTVVWSKQYDHICKSYDIIKDFSRSAGVDINLKKSDGISLLIRPGVPSEFDKVKHYFDFLGYRISVDKISIRDHSVQKIKAHISYLLYRHLIQPVRGKTLQALTVPNNDEDRDLVVAIQQIRRYLYGNLSDKLLEDYSAGRRGRLSFKGLMSFYPLVTNEEQLKELDGWLVHTVYHSLRKRRELFARHGHKRLASIFPYNVDQSDLVDAFARQLYRRRAHFYRLPSFMRVYRAIQRGIVAEGLGFTDNYGY